MYEIKKFDYTPILGWSNSRYDKFISCKREYFYRYYSKYDPTYTRKQIGDLKKMTSIPLEIGNIVHDVIEVLLTRLRKTEGEIDKEKFHNYAKRKTKEYCEKKIFSEVFYKEIEKIDSEEIYSKVEISLSNFLESDRFNWLTTEAIRNKSDWIIEPGGFGETRIDEMKAYCKVDFLFPFNDTIYILDWKTGKKDIQKHNRQLKGYSAWASYHFSKDPTNIIPIIAYLRPTYSEMEVINNEFDLEEFTNQVLKETEEMYSLCSNVNENIPKDKEAFVKTHNRIYCDYCNFRELCN